VRTAARTRAAIGLTAVRAASRLVREPMRSRQARSGKPTLQAAGAGFRAALAAAWPPSGSELRRRAVRSMPNSRGAPTRRHGRSCQTGCSRGQLFLRQGPGPDAGPRRRAGAIKVARVAAQTASPKNTSARRKLIPVRTLGAGPETLELDGRGGCQVKLASRGRVSCADFGDQLFRGLAGGGRGKAEGRGRLRRPTFSHSSTIPIAGWSPPSSGIRSRDQSAKPARSSRTSDLAAGAP